MLRRDLGCTRLFPGVSAGPGLEVSCLSPLHRLALRAKLCNATEFYFLFLYSCTRLLDLFPIVCCTAPYAVRRKCRSQLTLPQDDKILRVGTNINRIMSS